MPGLTGKKVLMIVSPTNFRDEELLIPKKFIATEGASINISSIGVRRARGMLGADIPVDLDVSEVKVEEYDAIVFVGGQGVSQYDMPSNPILHKIARDAVKRNLVLAAICLGPRILANAGVLNGKSATVWRDPESIAMLEKGGAVYSRERVVVDGNIITADGPASADLFARALRDKLESSA